MNPIENILQEVQDAATLADALLVIKHLTQELGAKQAQIDALMLEYCQEDMTPEQLENWGNHQRLAVLSQDEFGNFTLHSRKTRGGTNGTN